MQHHVSESRDALSSSSSAHIIIGKFPGPSASYELAMSESSACTGPAAFAKAAVMLSLGTSRLLALRRAEARAEFVTGSEPPSERVIE